MRLLLRCNEYRNSSANVSGPNSLDYGLTLLSGPPNPILLLRQGLAFGFRQKRKRNKPEQKDQADPHARDAESFDIAAKALGKFPDRERRARRRQPAKIIAETRAGAAETGGKELRKIDRINAKDG